MITDLHPDGDGNLWIATDGGGLNRYDPKTNSWKHFKYQPDYVNSLNSDALYDLLFDSAGNLWIGTFNGGINLHKVNSPPFVIDRPYLWMQRFAPVLCVAQD